MPRSAGHFSYLNFMKHCQQIILVCLLVSVAGACGNQHTDSGNRSSSDTTEQPGWALLPFEKMDSVNPVLTPGENVFFCPIRKDTVQWEEKDVFNPATVVRNDTLFMIYRAEDSVGKFAGTSRLGLAWSTDGKHFNRYAEPIFYPDNDDQKKYEWEGGCEDPRIVEDSAGRYILTYTSFDGKTARLMVASSPDLIHWTKYGPAFSGKYRDVWSKSGSIVSDYLPDGRIVARKINGSYWMYWGDVNIWAATSSDLVHWTPVPYRNNEKPTIELRHNSTEVAELKIVFGPRKKKFDSDLVEPGPPAMYTEKGILLLYNGRNVPSIGDASLAEGTYAASQVLMDKNDPSKLIDRMEQYFMKPDKPYEVNGQVNHVCFIEGLALYKNNWWLYYGTADSRIAGAVKGK
jgi:beta-1,2-mannosidase